MGRKLDQFHIREDLELSVLNSHKIRIDMIGLLAKKILMDSLTPSFVACLINEDLSSADLKSLM